jgi:type 1 glutamine amidotransferase
VDHQALDHPIVKGLPKRWHHFKDEIYLHLRGPAENLEIIATTRDGDRDEPLMWTVRYGKGRIFVDVLGHCGNDPEMTYAMTCTGYQTTLLRGCEWAATGTVTLPLPVDFPDKVRSTLRPDFKLPEQVGR